MNKNDFTSYPDWDKIEKEVMNYKKKSPFTYISDKEPEDVTIIRLDDDDDKENND